MKSGTYANVAITTLLIAVVVFGAAIVKSVDLFRFRVEALDKKIDSLSAAVARLDRGANAPFSASAAAETRGANRDETALGTPLANAEYFDRAAEVGGRLIKPIMSDTKNMNGVINNDAYIAEIWGLAYDALADRNLGRPELFQPMLAEKWDISPDKMTYTIRLRPGVLWHDFTDPVTGKEWKDVEVTAEDFKFYVDVIQNEGVSCPFTRVYYQDLAKVEVLSKYVFKAVWKRKYFRSLEMTLALSPLPRHFYHAYSGPFDAAKFNDDFQRNKMIVGCGPYRFVNWEAGKRVVMKRWEKYYGARYGVQPPIETVAFDVIKHPNTQLQSLFGETLDRMGLTAEQWVNRTDAPEFDPKSPKFKIRKFRYPSASYSYIGWNLHNPLFQDKRVRQALTCLVDRERILKDVYYDLGKVVTGPFFVDGPFNDASLKPYPFSVEKAKALFAEAGWRDTDGDGVLDKDGKKFQFSMLQIASSTNQEKYYPIIKEDMEKAGVLMNIVKVEWSVYTERLEKKAFDACSLAWQTSPLDADPYQIWHSDQADKPSSSNHIGFKNKTADALIDEIRECFDFQKRVELCHAFHRLLYEEQPYTFLVCQDSLLALNARYRNVRVFPKLAAQPTAIMWVPTAEQMPLP